MSRMRYLVLVGQVCALLLLGLFLPASGHALGGTIAGALDNPVQIDGTTPLVFSSSSSTASGLWSLASMTVYNNSWGTVAISGTITGGEYSSLTTTVTGTASISFYQKVSSEPVNDGLSFYIDNLTTPKYKITGAVNWQQKMFTLPTGTHTLVWKYAKNATVNGGSDAAWLDKVVVSPNTALKVTYPNGGEILTAGSTTNITWNAPAAAEKYDLYLSTNNGTTWGVLAKDQVIPNFTGITYSWPVVPVPAGGNKTACKVKVVAKNAANAVVGTDISDKPFTIKVLEVTSPNGGEIWSAKTGTYTTGFFVSGLTNTSASATISYTTDGGVTWPVIGKIMGGSAITPGPYTFDWKVPAVSAVKNAKVKVVIKSASGVVLATDTSNANFTILPVFTISGTVSGATVSGVTMTLGGDDSGTTTTNALGKYSFKTLLKGNYTISAAKTGNFFNPAIMALAVTTANITTANFKATASSDPMYTLSGSVSGATTTNVIMTLAGTVGGSVQTAVDGTYSFGLLPLGNYSVTPGKTGYAFGPLSRGVTLSTADALGVDFTVSPSSGATYNILGKTTLKGAALPGVLINVTGNPAAAGVTDALGNYLIKGLKSGGTYTITPSKAGYVFSPTSVVRNITTANITIPNFIATVTLSARGTVAIGSPISSATVTVTGADGSIRTGVTAGDGTYTVDTTGLPSPYLLLATTGTGTNLYSVSAGSGANNVINITPFTDLIIRTWYDVQGVSIDSAFASPGTNPPPSPTAVAVISSVVRNMVQLWLNQANVTASDFNLISTPFSADGTGVDAVLAQTTVDPATGSVLVSDGTTTQVSTVSTLSSSLTISTTTTGSDGTSSSNNTTVVPVPTAQQTALDGITTAFNNFAAVVNAKGGSLMVSDVSPFLDPNGLWSGANRSQWAARIVYFFAGKTISFSGIAIKSMNDTFTAADTIFQLSLSQGGQTSTEPQEFFFKKANGVWVMSGDNRIANVEVRANMVRSQGSGSGVNLVLEVNVDCPRSLPTVTSLSGVTITGGPWNATPLSYQGKSLDGSTTSDMFGIHAIDPAISGGASFTFVLTPLSGPTATYTLAVNAITTEAISITNLTGGSILTNASLGSPMTVNWTLPNTFALSHIQLGTVAYTGVPDQPDTIKCDDMGEQVVLGITSTTANVTIPSTCGGLPTAQAEIYLLVYGVNGELTTVYYTYQ